jgi:hypothetical protein
MPARCPARSRTTQTHQHCARAADRVQVRRHALAQHLLQHVAHLAGEGIAVTVIEEQAEHGDEHLGEVAAHLAEHRAERAIRSVEQLLQGLAQRRGIGGEALVEIAEPAADQRQAQPGIGNAHAARERELQSVKASTISDCSNTASHATGRITAAVSATVMISAAGVRRPRHQRVTRR